MVFINFFNQKLILQHELIECFVKFFLGVGFVIFDSQFFKRFFDLGFGVIINKMIFI